MASTAPYFANSTAVRVPKAVASKVYGVVGLSNTVREQLEHRPERARPPAPGRRAPSGQPAGCETPYPTEQQLANAILGISGFPFGYGGAPGCNGLTPSQLNGIYSAPHVGPRGQGKGVNIARLRAVRVPALRHQHLRAASSSVRLTPRRWWT